MVKSVSPPTQLDSHTLRPKFGLASINNNPVLFESPVGFARFINCLRGDKDTHLYNIWNVIINGRSENKMMSHLAGYLDSAADW